MHCLQKQTYYNLTVEETLKSLDTDKSGISENEAELRLKTYGLNEIVEKKKITALEIFFNQFKSVLTLILILARARRNNHWYSNHPDRNSAVEGVEH